MIQGHPFIIDVWDVLLIILAGLVRLVFALKAKATEKKGTFNLKKYFDNRHLVRWGGHLFTALVMGLFVPELVIDYLAPKWFPQVTTWHFTGDFVIGFAGYDLIKLAEKYTAPLIEKLTGKKIAGK